MSVQEAEIGGGGSSGGSSGGGGTSCGGATEPPIDDASGPVAALGRQVATAGPTPPLPAAAPATGTPSAAAVAPAGLSPSESSGGGVSGLPGLTATGSVRRGAGCHGQSTVTGPATLSPTAPATATMGIQPAGQHPNALRHHYQFHYQQQQQQQQHLLQHQQVLLLQRRPHLGRRRASEVSTAAGLSGNVAAAAAVGAAAAASQMLSVVGGGTAGLPPEGGGARAAQHVLSLRDSPLSPPAAPVGGAAAVAISSSTMQGTQLKKCLNEKHRREQENVYLEELAELISQLSEECRRDVGRSLSSTGVASAGGYSGGGVGPTADCERVQSATGSSAAGAAVKPDKCAILQETVNQIRRIKNRQELPNVSSGQELLLQVSPSKASILSSDVLGPLVLEALDGFLLVVDTMGKIEFVSENVSTYLGFEASTLEAKNIYAVLHPGDRSRFSSHLHPAQTGVSDNAGCNSGEAQQVSNRQKSRSFACRFLTKTAKEASRSLANTKEGDQSSPAPVSTDTALHATPASRYLDMHLSAITINGGVSAKGTGGLSSSTSCLLCIARRLSSAPEISADSNKFMRITDGSDKLSASQGIATGILSAEPVEQFTTRLDSHGRVMAIDVTGVNASYVSLLKNAFGVGRLIQEACDSRNDLEHLNEHLQLTLASGQHTSAIYQVRARIPGVSESVLLRVRTKSKKFSPPPSKANDGEFVNAVHSIIIDSASSLVSFNDDSNLLPSSPRAATPVSMALGGPGTPVLSGNESSVLGAATVGCPTPPLHASSLQQQPRSHRPVTGAHNVLPGVLSSSAVAVSRLSLAGSGNSGASSNSSASLGKTLSTPPAVPSISLVAGLQPSVSGNSGSVGGPTALAGSTGITSSQSLTLSYSAARSDGVGSVGAAIAQRCSNQRSVPLSSCKPLPLANIGQSSEKLRNLLIQGKSGSSTNPAASSLSSLASGISGGFGGVGTAGSSSVSSGAQSNTILKQLLNSPGATDTSLDAHILVKQESSQPKLSVILSRKADDTDALPPAGCSSGVPALKRIKSEPGASSSGSKSSQHLAGQNPMLASMLAQTPRPVASVPSSIATAIVSQIPQDRLPKNLEKKLLPTPVLPPPSSTSTQCSSLSSTLTIIAGNATKSPDTSGQGTLCRSASSIAVSSGTSMGVEMPLRDTTVVLGQASPGSSRSGSVTTSGFASGLTHGAGPLATATVAAPLENTKSADDDSASVPCADPLLSQILDEVWTMQEELQLTPSPTSVGSRGQAPLNSVALRSAPATPTNPQISETPQQLSPAGIEGFSPVLVSSSQQKSSLTVAQRPTVTGSASRAGMVSPLGFPRESQSPQSAVVLQNHLLSPVPSPSPRPLATVSAPAGAVGICSPVSSAGQSAAASAVLSAASPLAANTPTNETAVDIHSNPPSVISMSSPPSVPLASGGISPPLPCMSPSQLQQKPQLQLQKTPPAVIQQQQMNSSQSQEDASMLLEILEELADVRPSTSQGESVSSATVGVSGGVDAKQAISAIQKQLMSFESAAVGDSQLSSSARPLIGNMKMGPVQQTHQPQHFAMMSPVSSNTQFVRQLGSVGHQHVKLATAGPSGGLLQQVGGSRSSAFGNQQALQELVALPSAYPAAGTVGLSQSALRTQLRTVVPDNHQQLQQTSAGFGVCSGRASSHTAPGFVAALHLQQQRQKAFQAQQHLRLLPGQPMSSPPLTCSNNTNGNQRQAQHSGPHLQPGTLHQDGHQQIPDRSTQLQLINDLVPPPNVSLHPASSKSWQECLVSPSCAEGSSTANATPSNRHHRVGPPSAQSQAVPFSQEPPASLP